MGFRYSVYIVLCVFVCRFLCDFVVVVVGLRCCICLVCLCSVLLLLVFLFCVMFVCLLFKCVSAVLWLAWVFHCFGLPCVFVFGVVGSCVVVVIASFLFLSSRKHVFVAVFCV